MTVQFGQFVQEQRARLTPGVQTWAEKVKIGALSLLPPLFWDVLVVKGSAREAGVGFHPLLDPI